MKIQPDSMPDKKCGLLFVSVSQSDNDQESNCTTIKLACSGIVVCPEILQDNTVHTRVIFLAQIDVQNSLQSMLEGSYKSGLLKIGLRNAFSHVRSNIEEYNNMLSGI
ncbi:Hypothetical predicted protein [Paramuricea clavata]|uniref:Uncharacterized protein n=1 Tax=Paramuricea clavata TaxID=317549 RepID=A0A7D9HYK6_PARCT|nr:Hypothetical predicted protein [Paramuricea clavata]